MKLVRQIATLVLKLQFNFESVLLINTITSARNRIEKDRLRIATSATAVTIRLAAATTATNINISASSSAAAWFDSDEFDS